MRRALPALMFMFGVALTLLPAGEALAGVLRSAHAGVTFYTWSDALTVRDKAAYGTGLVCFPSGACVRVESGRWAADVEAEALAPGLASDMDALVGRLVALGVGKEALEGLAVYILPAWDVNISGEVEGAAGVYIPGERALLIAGLWWGSERVFLHEVGHYLAEKVLNVVAGYGWGLANDKGREYLRVRGYPEERGLDMVSQSRLEWEDRAAEWFAEDFAYWAAKRLGRAEWLSMYLASCGPPDQRVLEWFDTLFEGR